MKKKNFSIKTSEILLMDKKEGPVCDTFVYEPTNVDEENLGSLYMVGKVENREVAHFLNLLASIIRREYYFNTKRKPIDSLENALKKVNLALSDLSEAGNVALLENIEFIVAILIKPFLHFAQVGETKAFLLRGKELVDIGKNLRETPNTYPFKSFGAIASGELEEADRLLFATSDLLKSFSLEELKKLSLKNKHQELCLKIEGTFREQNPKCYLGMILLEVEKEVFPLPRPSFTSPALNRQIPSSPAPHLQPRSKEDTDIEELLTLEQIIKEASEGSLEEESRSVDLKRKESKSIFLKEFSQRFRNWFPFLVKFRPDDFLKKLYPFKKKPLNLSQESSLPESATVSSLGLCWRKKTGTLFRFLRDNSYLKNLSALFQRKKTSTLSGKGIIHQEILEKAMVKPKNLLSAQLINKISNRKIISVISIILGLTLTIAGISFLQKRKETEEITYYKSLLSEAANLQSQAEAALIYRDEEKARRLYEGAKESLEKIMTSSYFKGEAAGLYHLIQNQFETLNYIERLDNPELIIDFNQAAVRFFPEGILGMGNSLYLYSKGDDFVYKLTPGDNKGVFTFAELNRDEDFLAASSFPEKSLLIFLTDNKRVSVYDIRKDEFKNYELDSPFPQSEMNVFSTYSNNVYFFDKLNREIIKFKLTLDSFSSGTKWLKQQLSQEAAEIISMAIDGNIYLLDPNGIVLKYINGSLVETIEPFLWPAYERPTKLLTDVKMDNIYLLDPSEKRVIILNKKGQLLKQYISESFDNLLDFWISADGKSIFLLNGEKIFRIGL